MDMITVQQVAEKWGVSARYVQVLCKKGKLPGAAKFGLNWMIPADAEKPKDGRLRSDGKENDRKPYIVMPKQTPQFMMSVFYCKPGTAANCIESLSDTPETAMLFNGWLSFYQGNLKQALDIVLPLLETEADFYGTLNVGMLTMACAVWKNDAVLWRTARAHISAVACGDKAEREIKEFWFNITDANVVNNTPKSNRNFWEAFYILPEDSLPLAWFYYAKHLHNAALQLARGETATQDVQGMGMMQMYPYMAEPLIVQAHRDGALLSELCMRLLCASAYFNIGEEEKGFHHLDTALNLAVPDKLYGILAEFRELFNTVMDDRLAAIDPEVAKAVKKLHKSTLENWNAILGQPITLTLTERQREIAKLAALGLTNEEIATRLHISFSTVKSTVSMIMNRTGTTKRSEFRNHIF